MERFGYASTDYRETEKKIRKGAVDGQPDLPEKRRIKWACVFVIFYLTNPRLFKSLVCLGSSGNQRDSDPACFFGFSSNRLADTVERARVILMFGECRVPFKPNIYRVWHDSADLKQVWLINVVVFNDLIFPDNQDLVRRRACRRVGTFDPCPQCFGVHFTRFA